MHKYDLNTIEKYINEGLLRRTWNESKSLMQIDYTEKCTFAGKWDEITSSCRGIVLDCNGNVVMPCIPKFFNYEQLSADERNEITKLTDYQLTMKYDGTLGFIFYYKDQLVLCSKCSFNNFVVDAMKRILNGCETINCLKDNNVGLVVEVISPETRILVDYKGVSELRVITSFNLNDLKELQYNETKKIVDAISFPNIKMVEIINMSFNQLRKWQSEHDYKEEGFVAKYNDGKRVKFKSEDYLRVTALRVYLDYTHLYNEAIEISENHPDDWNKELYKKIAGLPDELQKTGIEMVNNIYAETEFIYGNIIMLNQKYKDLSDKEIGLKVNDDELNKYKYLIFSIRHDKAITKELLKLAKKEYQEFMSLPQDEKKLYIDRILSAKQDYVKEFMKEI